MLKVSKERMLKSVLGDMVRDSLGVRTFPLLTAQCPEFPVILSCGTSVSTLLFIHQKPLVNILNTFLKPQFLGLEKNQPGVPGAAWPAHGTAVPSPAHPPQLAAKPLWSGPQGGLPVICI